MKTSRKGFTLVELLIVVAILATLTATMMASISGSTAKAKAATIAANVEACKTAATMYVTNNASDSLKTMKTEDMMVAAMPTWADFGHADTDAPIQYATTDKVQSTGTTTAGQGPDNWAITVDFSKDPEKDDIKTALQAIKGYNKYYKHTAAVTDATTGTVTTPAKDDPTVIMDDDVYKFEVVLISGRVQPVTE